MTDNLPNNNSPNNNNNNQMVDDMIKWRESLLEETGKNTFFKSSQKKELAKSVCQNQNFNLQQVLHAAIYRVYASDQRNPYRELASDQRNPYSNGIYMDYPILKLFINETVYDAVIEHILRLYDECIAEHGSYYLYLNLSGFTISAVDRYKACIIQFTDRCMIAGTKYISMLEKIKILNTPSAFDAIIKMLKPFIPKEVGEKIETVNKAQSASILDEVSRR
jgi:hypothetical protein